MSEPHPPREIDVTHPSVAGTYGLLLGGTDNYPTDRDEVATALAKFPGLKLSGPTIRAFMVRAVRYLAGEAGITQFLDVGCGLPTGDENVHQIARRASADARVMYVDSDPIVYSHGRALLVDPGRTDYFEADVRDVEVVLGAAGALLDFSRPVGLLLSAVLHWVPEDPVPLVARYVAALAPGSYVVVSHSTAEGAEPGAVDQAAKVFPGGWYARPYEHIARVFEGLELVEPGLTLIQDWRPGDGAEPVSLPTQLYGAVARVVV